MRECLEVVLERLIAHEAQEAVEEEKKKSEAPPQKK
jgi:hypothetical protein